MILCRRLLLLPEMQLSNYSADKNKPWFPHSLTICSLHYECFSDPHRRWEGAGHHRVPDSLTFVPTSQLMRLGRVMLSHPTPPCPVHPTTQSGLKQARSLTGFYLMVQLYGWHCHKWVLTLLYLAKSGSKMAGAASCQKAGTQFLGSFFQNWRLLAQWSDGRTRGLAKWDGHVGLRLADSGQTWCHFCARERKWNLRKGKEI